jgi:hypothetical protein
VASDAGNAAAEIKTTRPAGVIEAGAEAETRMLVPRVGGSGDRARTAVTAGDGQDIARKDIIEGGNGRDGGDPVALQK